MGSFGEDLGPLLIGPLITTFLYGVSTLQTYIYFTRHSADRREMKIWVSLIWIIDTTQVILVCYGIYFWVFGHPLSNTDNAFSDKGKRTMEASSGMNLLMAFMVQCFFVKRIFQLSRDFYRYWLFAGLALLTAAHLVLGSVAIVKVIHALALDSSVRLSSLTLPAVLPYTIAAVFSDLCLAIALILLLRTRRSDLDHMNSVLDRAVNFVLTRCLLVTAGAVVRLITFAALPNATWFIAVDFMIGKVYSNSLLAMLNSRQSSSRISQDTPLETGHLFTTVVDIPSGGPESTTTSAQTSSFPQRGRVDHRSPAGVLDSEAAPHQDEEYKDSHYIPPYLHE